MAPVREGPMKRKVKAGEAMKNSKREVNKGSWTAEEDQKLAEVIEIHGAKRWKAIASKAGLNRCGKSCRLRWLNYLRPNIKRGNISDQEEDLILRLHKLLGNRWSLIAGRLPGRTDNEIKNYWNSHLSKRMKPKEKQLSGANSTRQMISRDENRSLAEDHQKVHIEMKEDSSSEDGTSTTSASKGGNQSEQSNMNNRNIDEDDFFDFSNEGALNLEWVNQFLELPDGRWLI